MAQVRSLQSANFWRFPDSTGSNHPSDIPARFLVALSGAGCYRPSDARHFAGTCGSHPTASLVKNCRIRESAGRRSFLGVGFWKLCANCAYFWSSHSSSGWRGQQLPPGRSSRFALPKGRSASRAVRCRPTSSNKPAKSSSIGRFAADGSPPSNKARTGDSSSRTACLPVAGSSCAICGRTSEAMTLVPT
jgi:hypothetical protein